LCGKPGPLTRLARRKCSVLATFSRSKGRGEARSPIRTRSFLLPLWEKVAARAITRAAGCGVSETESEILDEEIAENHARTCGARLCGVAARGNCLLPGVGANSASERTRACRSRRRPATSRAASSRRRPRERAGLAADQRRRAAAAGSDRKSTRLT